MYLYHGTNRENAESIMKEGFLPYTYFTPFLDSALCYGGEYVFAIWKDGIPLSDEKWQFQFDCQIPPKEIIALVRYGAEMLFAKDNPYLMEGKCGRCHGAGELFKTDEERFSRAWLPKTHPIHANSLRHCDVCPECKGYGRINEENEA